ncbi:sulfurtransferase TusA family protein [Chromohalobacter sp. HP20-39]|uniref:sulfurtransferase TusA family protein n=1 Tax=Chromohalobacter sp. HP20-39 TaxID=3079306 RepID=UPI00294AC6B8|nr:sulfurtransferase TusA family protein [Chromohalobacter sp. HP20-39]MDV6317864.1 sulfurtransferase TusA family protein [Chromohalobacter sp. HP20-39]
MALQPDHVLDACGLHCPLPLLKAKQALSTLEVGALLEVKATDAGSWQDFESFAAQGVHHLEAREEKDGIYHYWLRKGERGSAE